MKTFYTLWRSGVHCRRILGNLLTSAAVQFAVDILHIVE